MIVSAQLATMTRLCAAEACEGDAEPYSRLCYRCSRKPAVRIHTPPSIDTSPSLRCCTCGEYKPDRQFPLQRANKMRARRNRNSECNACCNQRRRNRFYKRQCIGMSGKHSRRCRGYAQLDSDYCNLHRP